MKADSTEEVRNHRKVKRVVAEEHSHHTEKLAVVEGNLGVVDSLVVEGILVEEGGLVVVVGNQIVAVGTYSAEVGSRSVEVDSHLHKVVVVVDNHQWCILVLENSFIALQEKEKKKQ